MLENIAYFRIHSELNDFLNSKEEETNLPYKFRGNPSIKDAIEAIGIPHPEVDVIVVNHFSVDFNYHLINDDNVSVYPSSSRPDISKIVKLKDIPRPRFILDVHLGKLARLLRMLGIDSLYRNNYNDREIAQMAPKTNRIVLTRDRKLLKYKIITHGYWIRSFYPNNQLIEVLKHYKLESELKPFHRCLECNGVIKSIDKDKVQDRLEPKTKVYYEKFYKCTDCEKIYWKGSHYENMKTTVDNLIN